MKINPTRSPRAFAALLPTLLLATPALAQEATPSAPPVVQSAPPTAPDPVVQAAPPAADPVAMSTVAPPPVVPTISDTPAQQAAPVGRRTTPRAAPVARTVAPAPRSATPVAARPAPVEAPAPAAAAPIAATPPAPVAETPAPVGPTNDAATTTQTTRTNGAIWPWIVGGLVILAGLAALLLRRRRRTDDEMYEEAYQEPAFVEPVPAMAEPAPLIVPVAAPRRAPEPQLIRPAPVATDPVEAPAPVPAEESIIADADQADIDALTDGHAPVANRPWLEFGMRPVRAGTTSDEALVEIELTVGNAGSVAADDVRISTFLFASEPADADEFERILLEHGHDGSADPVSIAAGEGTRVDATLALPKANLAEMFKPVVVADARYRLPDGSEGRTFASFSIGMTQENGELGAMENIRPSMHDDVEARLYGTPEHV